MKQSKKFIKTLAYFSALAAGSLFLSSCGTEDFAIDGADAGGTFELDSSQPFFPELDNTNVSIFGIGGTINFTRSTVRYTIEQNDIVAVTGSSASTSPIERFGFESFVGLLEVEYVPDENFIIDILNEELQDPTSQISLNIDLILNFDGDALSGDSFIIDTIFDNILISNDLSVPRIDVGIHPISFLPGADEIIFKYNTHQNISYSRIRGNLYATDEFVDVQKFKYIANLNRFVLDGGTEFEEVAIPTITSTATINFR